MALGYLAELSAVARVRVGCTYLAPGPLVYEVGTAFPSKSLPGRQAGMTMLSRGAAKYLAVRPGQWITLKSRPNLFAANAVLPPSWLCQPPLFGWTPASRLPLLSATATRRPHYSHPERDLLLRLSPALVSFFSAPSHPQRPEEKKISWRCSGGTVRSRLFVRSLVRPRFFSLSLSLSLSFSPVHRSTKRGTWLALPRTPLFLRWATTSITTVVSGANRPPLSLVHHANRPIVLWTQTSRARGNHQGPFPLPAYAVAQRFRLNPPPLTAVLRKWRSAPSGLL